MMEILCHGKTTEVYQKLKTQLQLFQSRGTMAQLEKITFYDEVYEVLAQGTGFKSKMQCQDGKVIVELDLNFLLKPLRGQIEEKLKKKLTAALS